MAAAATEEEDQASTLLSALRDQIGSPLAAEWDKHRFAFGQNYWKEAQLDIGDLTYSEVQTVMTRFKEEIQTQLPSVTVRIINDAYKNEEDREYMPYPDDPDAILAANSDIVLLHNEDGVFAFVFHGWKEHEEAAADKCLCAKCVPDFKGSGMMHSWAMG